MTLSSTFALLIRSPAGDPDIEPIGRLSGSLELGEVDAGGDCCCANRLNVVGGAALHCRPDEPHAIAVDAAHVVGAQPILDVLLRCAVSGDRAVELDFPLLRLACECNNLGDEFRARLDDLGGDGGTDVAAGAGEGTAFAFATAGDPALRG